MTRRRHMVIGVALAAITALGVPAALAHHGPPYTTGPEHEHGEMVAYPMVFPVGGISSFGDTFSSPRCCDPGEIHHAIDIMSPKMTPVFAVAGGTVRYVNWSHDPGAIDSTRCCTLAIRHDDDWETWYIHLNNDTPGTDDGQGWGVAEGILPGVRVQAGQLIGWVGDSGNAEGTSPHLHFELIDPYGVRVNPYQALRTARDGAEPPLCDGIPATIFGDDDGDGIILGTSADDVIVGTGGNDDIRALEGADLVCGGRGRDTIDGGPGADTIFGGAGSDTIMGGDDPDLIVGGRRSDRMYGGGGDDTLRGEQGVDIGDGGPGDDACLVENPTACEA